LSHAEILEEMTRTQTEGIDPRHGNREDLHGGSDESGGKKASEATAFPPNIQVLEVLKAVRERQQSRKPSDPAGSQDYLREARSGGMYGFGPDDESAQTGN
jgi:hypothetical protein